MRIDTVVKTVTIFSISVIFSACAPTSRVVQDYSYNADLTDLELDESYLPTIVYLRPGSASFDAYNRFIVDPVMVNYDDPKLDELDPDTVAKMQAYFHDGLVKTLREGGYNVGTRTETGTLRISLHLSDLKAPSAKANVVSAIAPFAISVGEITVEAQFKEAVSNRLDIVAVANTRGSHVVNTKPWSTWADIEGALDQWIKGIRQAIDKAHNKHKPSS